MALQRRNFLLFLGASVGTVTTGCFPTTGKDEGLLIVNFEYISSKPWFQTYKQVIGKSLPFEEVDKALKPVGKMGNL